MKPQITIQEIEMDAELSHYDIELHLSATLKDVYWDFRIPTQEKKFSKMIVQVAILSKTELEDWPLNFSPWRATHRLQHQWTFLSIWGGILFFCAIFLWALYELLL